MTSSLQLDTSRIGSCLRRAPHALFVVAFVALLAISISPVFAQSFTSAPASAIPDNTDGVRDNIIASNASDSFDSIRVTLNVTHTEVADLEVYLVPPTTTWIAPYNATTVPTGAIALSANSGSGGNYTSTEFVYTGDAIWDATSAAGSIAAGTAPYTGTFIPDEQAELAALVGGDANGMWGIVVFDEAATNTGTLDAWTIEFHGHAVFPYLENFDSNPRDISSPVALNNNWINVLPPTDGGTIDWNVDNAGTGSSGTGPSVDHTTGSTIGMYLYVEDSSTTHTPMLLDSPAFDLTSVAGAPGVEFWVHANDANDVGPTNNELHVDVIEVRTGTVHQDVIPVIRHIGAALNVWTQVIVPLTPYLPAEWVVVRFRHHDTGTSFSHDIAIDDVSLIALTNPEIDVQRPVASSIADGGTDNLGVVPTGTPTTYTYTIQNVGGGTINVTPPVTIANTVNCTATITTQPGTTLGATATTTFSVEVTVGVGGPFSFDISIVNDDADENPYDIMVTGTGPAPVMDVQRPLGISVPDGGADNLGTVNPGAATPFTYNILNTGSADLNLTGTPFVAITSTVNCTATVSTQPASPITFPSGSTTFVVDVTPTTAGAFSFDISIDNDDPTANPYNFAVNGQAPLSGSFDVGGGALDYTDIGAAFDALELLGVGGPVTFNVYDDPGMYTATLSYELNTFTGMGPTNQVTVQAAAGESPVITGAVNIMSSGPDVIIYLENVSGVSIIGLEFDGQGTDEAAIGWYNFGTIADGHTIERCRIHGFQGSAIGVYDPSSPSEFQNCLIANNFVWDCQAISFSTYDDGVLWGRRMGGTRVIHNTFVHSATATGVMFHHEVSGVGTELSELANNIFYNDTSGTNMYSNSGGHPAVADGNIWYLGTGVTFSAAAPLTFADWQALGLDANGYNADPLLVDPANGDLHLQNPSPAHDLAVVTTPPLTVDIDGDTRPAGSADDIGADEEPAPIPPPSMTIQRPVGVVLQNGVTDAQGSRTIQAAYNLTYTIENGGPGDLVINSATLLNQTNCTATIQLAPTSPLTAGNTTSLIVTVTVTATGPFSFEVEIDSNDIFAGLFTIPVSGNGIAEPDISVQRPAATPVASGGLDLVASTTPGTPVDLIYTIENTGLATLNLSGTPIVAVGTATNCTATVTAQPASTALAVGATTTFQVQVTSTAAGSYAVFISIASDDPDEDPFVFTILGQAASVSTGGGDSGGCAATTGANGATGNAALLLLAALVMGLLLSRRRFTA